MQDKVSGARHGAFRQQRLKLIACAQMAQSDSAHVGADRITHADGCAGAQTARRLRPLARRALMTARPPRVFMRTRKPWVRARRVLEGW